MPAGIGNKGLLDPKQCWKDWNLELGTLNAVREKLRKQGVINPSTGEPPTASAIEKAAFSWAIHNQEEARRDLAQAWRNFGYVLTDEEWRSFLGRASNLVYYQRPRKLERFRVQNGIR
jgi:hypothetical protein